MLNLVLIIINAVTLGMGFSAYFYPSLRMNLTRNMFITGIIIMIAQIVIMAVLSYKIMYQI